MLDILHIHGFKCAGSTFASILHKNYYENLLSIDSNLNERFCFNEDSLQSFLKNYKAVTSHSLKRSKLTDENFLKTVFFIRDPFERLISAYRFERFKQDEIELSLYKYIVNNNNYSQDYQTSLLIPDESMQDENIENIIHNYSAEKSNLFLGVVELFDESLVVLEEEMMAHNTRIDLSYSNALNVQGHIQMPKFIKECIKELSSIGLNNDHFLYAEAKKVLFSKISNIDNFDEKLLSFKNRCAKVSKMFSIDDKNVISNSFPTKEEQFKQKKAFKRRFFNI